MISRELELLHKIHRRRKVQLRGKITRKSVAFVRGKLERLSRDSHKPICLNISSGGGDFWAAMEIYRMVKECPVPVFGVVSHAYSGALLVLQGCRLRVGRVNSRYGVSPVHHDHSVRVTPYTDPRLVASVVEEHLSRTITPYMREVWAQAHEILLERVSSVGKTESDLHKLLAHGGTILSAKDALKWGFIDCVVRNPRLPSSTC